MLKRIIQTLFVCVVVLSATFIRASESAMNREDEGTVARIMRLGVLRVGLDVFVPWAMKDKKGELIGFEIDVATKLAHDMGVRVEFVPTRWSGIIPSLIAAKFDVIIGGMTATPERSLKIDFTRPYYFTGQGVLANRKLTRGFALDDFNRAGITLAARLGSTAALAAKTRFPKAALRLFDDEPAAVQEVKNGRVHALVAGQPLPAHTAARAPEVLIAYPDQLMEEPICMGVRKGDADLLKVLNDWIENIQSSRWIEERRRYWFDSAEWQTLVR